MSWEKPHIELSGPTVEEIHAGRQSRTHEHIIVFDCVHANAVA